MKPKIYTTRKNGTFWQTFRRQRNSSEFSDEFMTEYRRNAYFSSCRYFVGNVRWNSDKTNVVGKFRCNFDHSPRKIYIRYAIFLDVLNFSYSSEFRRYIPTKFRRKLFSRSVSDGIPTNLLTVEYFRQISNDMILFRRNFVGYVGNFPL